MGDQIDLDLALFFACFESLLQSSLAAMEAAFKDFLRAPQTKEATNMHQTTLNRSHTSSHIYNQNKHGIGVRNFLGNLFFLFWDFFFVVGTVSSLFPCFPWLFLGFSLVFLHFSSRFPCFPLFFFSFYNFPHFFITFHYFSLVFPHVPHFFLVFRYFFFHWFSFTSLIFRWMLPFCWCQRSMFEVFGLGLVRRLGVNLFMACRIRISVGNA